MPINDYISNENVYFSFDGKSFLSRAVNEIIVEIDNLKVIYKVWVDSAQIKIFMPSIGGFEHPIRFDQEDLNSLCTVSINNFVFIAHLEKMLYVPRNHSHLLTFSIPIQKEHVKNLTFEKDRPIENRFELLDFDK